MARTVVTFGFLCCLVAAVLAGWGCLAGPYNVSFGLAESDQEDFQGTGRLHREPLRDRRERETDRTAHDLDGDGIPDDRDADIDGDGIPNNQDPDDDNDGIPDDQDPDDNNDGVIDALNR